MKNLKFPMLVLTVLASTLIFFSCTGNDAKVIEAVRNFEVTYGGVEPYKVKDIEMTLVNPQWAVVYDGSNDTYFALLSGVYDGGNMTDKRVQEIFFTVSSDFTKIDAGGSGDSKKDLTNTMILIRNWPGQIRAWKERNQ